MDIEPIEKFWMVWNPERSAPRFRHQSKGDACAEAARLSRRAPGEMFFVLAAVDAVTSPLSAPQSVKLVKPRPSRDLDDEIPF
jgi:hypothetical protein